MCVILFIFFIISICLFIVRNIKYRIFGKQDIRARLDIQPQTGYLAEYPTLNILYARIRARLEADFDIRPDTGYLYKHDTLMNTPPLAQQRSSSRSAARW